MSYFHDSVILRALLKSLYMKDIRSQSNNIGYKDKIKEILLMEEIIGMNPGKMQFFSKNIHFESIIEKEEMLLAFKQIVEELEKDHGK